MNPYQAPQTPTGYSWSLKDQFQWTMAHPVVALFFTCVGMALGRYLVLPLIDWLSRVLGPWLPPPFNHL